MAESPYATALVLKRPTPSWVSSEDIPRITAYGTYEDMWNNVPDAYAELLRSDDDEKARRYIPAIRTLIEATNRYLARGFDTTWEPIAGATIADEAMTEFMDRLDALFRREEFGIKFLALKRWKLIRGDGLLMLSADPAKPEGSRIRITELPASQYFPIWDPNDSERVAGCYLASIVLNDAGEEIIQRIEYRRILSQNDIDKYGGALGNVWYRLGFYDKGHWDDRAIDADPLQPVKAPSWAPVVAAGGADIYAGALLPAEITAIPVYHFRNNRRGGIEGRFGTSEVQGMESLFAGLIQNATDEDTTVAMNGLGVYWTDSGKPRDARGAEVPWVIGPASMLEVEKDGKVGRLAGVTSVQPYQDHMNYLQGSSREASAVPEIAVGRVGASTSSGVALAIEFMPIIAKNDEKQEELTSRLTQMLFDLVNGWMPAYEEWAALPITGTVTFEDPMPVDRAAVLKEILDMVTAKVVSISWAQTAIADRLGYQFPATMLQDMITEQESMLDAVGARAAIDGAAAADPTQA